MKPERSDIPIGRDNAIRRSTLAHYWNTNSRGVRRIIAGFRTDPKGDGYAILSTTRRGAGYWRSNDPDEIRVFIREMESRAKNTFLALRGAKRVLRKAEAGIYYGPAISEESTDSVGD